MRLSKSGEDTTGRFSGYDAACCCLFESFDIGFRWFIRGICSLEIEKMRVRDEENGVSTFSGWTGFWFSFVAVAAKTCRRGLCCFFVAMVVSVVSGTETGLRLTGANNVELNRFAKRTELRVTERVFFVFESVVIWLEDSAWDVVVPGMIENEDGRGRKGWMSTLNFLLF